MQRQTSLSLDNHEYPELTPGCPSTQNAKTNKFSSFSLFLQVFFILSTFLLNRRSQTGSYREYKTFFMSIKMANQNRIRKDTSEPSGKNPLVNPKDLQAPNAGI
jgi:hypothetical protein